MFLLRIVHDVIVERFEGGQRLRGNVISILCCKIESDYLWNAQGAMMCVLKKFHCIIKCMDVMKEELHILLFCTLL